VIEVTDEMRAAFRADRDDWCDEIGCGRDDCLTERLAAVLAIVERDYRIEPRPPWDRVHGTCRKCGLELQGCFEEGCPAPAQCGDAWCSEHAP
jgi:hypothetical protein